MNVFRIAFVSIAIPCAALAAPIELMEGEVVAFAGGTDLVRLQNDGRFEAALTEKFKAAEPKFRDFAWDGDTVSFQTTVRALAEKRAIPFVSQDEIKAMRTSSKSSPCATLMATGWPTSRACSRRA